MATLSESRFSRFLTFGAMYFAQGVPWGFISTGYVVFLTDQGLNNEAIGASIGLAFLPWSFKILWGPLVDRFPSARFGRRRPFIIGAELLMGLTLLPLLLIDPKKDLGLIGALLLVHNSFAALQDVSVDALAVDILPKEERGSANSVMWASKSGGVAVGGGAGTILAKHFGWSTLFITIALLLWAVMVLAIVVRERPRAAEAEASRKRMSIKELRASFSFSTPLVGLLIAFFTPAGYALTNVVQTRLYRADLRLSEEAIATLSGAVSPLSGAVGALVGGWFADRMGVRKVIAIAMVGIALSLGAFAVLESSWPSFAFLIGWTIVSQIFIYAFSAASLGFFMGISNPAIGATQFTAYMAATNLTYACTAWAGGAIADRLGVAATFAIAAVAQLLPIALLPLCDPRRAEARFRQTETEPRPLPEPGKAPGA